MECVFLPIHRYLFQGEQIWLDCALLTVALQCTSADNRYVLVLSIRRSGFVGRTTECVNPIFFAPSSASSMSVKNVTNVLLRQLHDHLRVVKYLWNAWTCLWIHEPCCVLLLLGLFLHFRWLITSDTSFGFRTALNLTGECSPCVCARGSAARRLRRRLQILGVRYLQEEIVVRLVIYAPKISHFLVVVAVLVLLWVILTFENSLIFSAEKQKWFRP